MVVPSEQPTGPVERAPRVGTGWRRGLAVGAATVVLIGSGVGVGMALASTYSPTSTAGDSAMPGMGQPNTSPSANPSPAKGSGKAGGAGHHVDAARQAWAHQYGVDRSTMPNLAPVGSAPAQQQAAATDLLMRTEAATAQYADPAKAAAAGFDLQASLKNAEKRHPKLAQAIQRIDAGGAGAGGQMPMLHVANKANRTDGKVLDPSAPETLMYGYQGQGKWMLMGVMYTANETYPQAPPDPGGPITRWHYHDKSGGQSLMMHIFFVPGNDLAHAYAADMKS